MNIYSRGLGFFVVCLLFVVGGDDDDDDVQRMDGWMDGS